MLRIVLGSIAALLLLFWRWARGSRMDFLRRHMIPGPQPHWLWGNLGPYLGTPNVLWDTKMINEYGTIAGYFFGAKPVIVTSELRLIERIMGGEGNHFLHRPRRVSGGINPDPRRAEMLGNLEVPQWRILRGILNKGFSPAKLQNMSTDANNLIQVLMEELPVPVDGEKSQPIDFYSLYQNLTLDLIFKTGFGIHSDTQRNPNDVLKAAVEQEFSKSTSTFLLKFYICFPELHRVLHPIRVALENLKQWMGFGHTQLWDLGLRTVRQRQGEVERETRDPAPTDLLHLMLSSRKLSEMSVVANSVLFFEAGFETLSASLAFITHLLLWHPSVQDTLRKEITDILMETGGLLESVATLNRFTFLDAVIKEGLRMYPPQTTFIGRSGDTELEQTYTTANGARGSCVIPKNTHIQVGLYQILNSDATWEAPREFRPQRFLGQLSSDQAIAYQPFGKGKRICIGKKYADMILKMVFIEIFKKYRILPALPNGGPEIEVVYKTATMTPKFGVFGSVVWDPLFPADAPQT